MIGMSIIKAVNSCAGVFSLAAAGSSDLPKSVSRELTLVSVEEVAQLRPVLESCEGDLRSVLSVRTRW